MRKGGETETQLGLLAPRDTSQPLGNLKMKYYPWELEILHSIVGLVLLAVCKMVSIIPMSHPLSLTLGSAM